jgi:hypothetical protein
MICTQVHTRHKSCARYTIGARYLYFKRNAEKFGVRVICKVRAIGLKIRYINFILYADIYIYMCVCVCLTESLEFSSIQLYELERIPLN